MDAQSVVLLAESVQHRLAGASPVVFRCRILYETFKATLHPLREVLNCLTFRPASRCKPSLKIVQLLFWYINRKWYYVGQAVTPVLAFRSGQSRMAQRPLNWWPSRNMRGPTSA